MCGCCQKPKPLSEFHGPAENLFYLCKPCVKAKNQKYRKNNQKKLYEYERMPARRHGRVVRANKVFNGPVVNLHDYENLIKQPCKYCGGKLEEAGVGLDRVDSSKGYAPDNVVPCCNKCNEIKNDSSLELLLEHLPKFIEGAKKLLTSRPSAKALNAFEKDLSFGNSAEEYLFNTDPEKFERLDGRKGDLRLTKSKKIIEVKTERRSDEQTPNIFVEKISNKNKGTKGGPWAASDNGCEYISYIFWPTKKIFTYKIKPLLNFLETKKYKPFEVTVSGSKAVGFIVPRADIAHLEISIEELK